MSNRDSGIVEELDRENKELKAYNAEIKQALSECLVVATNHYDLSESSREAWLDLITQSPSQSLADIKADAVIEAANTLCIKGDSVITVRYDKYIEYADNLRSKS